jgi:hypothetical protein
MPLHKEVMGPASSDNITNYQILTQAMPFQKAPNNRETPLIKGREVMGPLVKQWNPRKKVLLLDHLLVKDPQKQISQRKFSPC